MSDFEKRYQQLNSEQRKAVDQLDGPVLVIAGPGTGKTELLSLRIANILQKTDALPANILCLTFTDSAARTMRERLSGLIGSTAHQVSIHTFHSFGVDVMNRYPEHFWSFAQFKAADELAQLEILEEIFKELPHDNPLASRLNDRFTQLRDTSRAISYLKKAGLLPSEVRAILAANEAYLSEVEEQLAAIFSAPMRGKAAIAGVAEAAASLPTPAATVAAHPAFPGLENVLKPSLTVAVEEAQGAGSTKPLTAWRNDWLDKRNPKGEWQLRDRRFGRKLEAVADVYERYQTAMAERGFYDFDDMVLQVLEAVEQIDELRFDLQERYQYVLVDEFQDTNDAQLRLLYLLTDNPVNEGRPNVMVVGDDDQAIYKFQGAEVSNILNFADHYRDPLTVTLTDNYRSTQSILDLSRSIITQGEQRLENRLKAINKTLSAKGEKYPKFTIDSVELASPSHEYTWIAESIKQLLGEGQKASEIAVIGRNHRQLEALMPFLIAREIPVVYERRENILQQPHIRQLTKLLLAVDALRRNELAAANELISQVISYPFWELATTDIWEVSKAAWSGREWWLDVMQHSKNSKLEAIAAWLLELARDSQELPLEHLLDRVIGTPGPNQKAEDFVSPFRQYYFSDERFDNQRGEYLMFLSSLRVLRDRLREFRPDQQLTLADFVEFIALHETNEIPIVDETPFVSADEAVQVMTAHKAKGREFGAVFVVGCQGDIWEAKRNRQAIAFPHNLPITPAGDAFDDWLRLFFVAVTRAKHHLYLTCYSHDDRGRESLRASFLLEGELPFSPAQISAARPVQILEEAWQSYHPLPVAENERAVLRPLLERYQLSATHLISFLDLTEAGPQSFLLFHLLRFPQAPSAAAAYGAAVHGALQAYYAQLANSDQPGLEELLAAFEQRLGLQRMTRRDFEYFRARGTQALSHYLTWQGESFDPEHIIERDFATQGVAVGDARLTGKLDRIVIDKAAKTAVVRDWKTGGTLTKWRGGKTYDRLKAWRYQHQLAFYKLLVENSRDFTGHKVNEGVLDFVEAETIDETELHLELTVDDAAHSSALIEAVWKRIMTLDFPDTSEYEPTLEGIKQFEKDLLA